MIQYIIWQPFGNLAKHSLLYSINLIVTLCQCCQYWKWKVLAAEAQYVSVHQRTAMWHFGDRAFSRLFTTAGGRFLRRRSATPESHSKTHSCAKRRFQIMLPSSSLIYFGHCRSRQISYDSRDFLGPIKLRKKLSRTCRFAQLVKFAKYDRHSNRQILSPTEKHQSCQNILDCGILATKSDRIRCDTIVTPNDTLAHRWDPWCGVFLWYSHRITLQLH